LRETATHTRWRWARRGRGGGILSREFPRRAAPWGSANYNLDNYAVGEPAPRLSGFPELVADSSLTQSTKVSQRLHGSRVHPHRYSETEHRLPQVQSDNRPVQSQAVRPTAFRRLTYGQDAESYVRRLFNRQSEPRCLQGCGHLPDHACARIPRPYVPEARPRTVLEIRLGQCDNLSA